MAELAYCVPLGLPHSEFLSWSEDDQDKALAFLVAEAERCRGCGTRRTEWEKSRFAFVGESEQCLGCELLDMERENIEDNQRGMKVFLRPNPDAELEDEAS